MTELGYGLLAVVGGLIAGGLFFGGLWWTVARIPQAKRPALLVLTSMGVRLLLTMSVFYAVMAITRHILYLGLALVVFVGVRVVLSQRIRPKRQQARRDRDGVRASGTRVEGELAEGELHATES